MLHRLLFPCRRRHITTGALVVLWVIGSVLMHRPAGAAPVAGPSNEPDPQQQSADADLGFAFGESRGFLLAKVGLLVPRGDSDIFSFNEELLTLDGRSYLSGLFGADIGVALSSRIDLVFGFEYAITSPMSEFRDFVDEFDVPIIQQTRLRQVPLTASVRVNLVERGRSVGSYAWIPSKVVPYVGGGGSFMWWRYEQFGDFVDFFDLTIFTEAYQTQGWAPGLHAFGGVDVSIAPRIVVNVEGRYGWAEGELAAAFVDFEPIDLTSFRGTVGVAIRF